MSQQAGDIVGEYQLTRMLGSGGFGAVWEAVTRDGERVALKFVRPGLDADAYRRFAREARILSKLEHRNCIQFRELLDDGGRLVIVTELLDGETLGQWSQRPRTVAEILDVARQLSGGLQAAHDRGVVHRDLKPANIIVSRSDTGLQVKILDFGIATLTASDQHDITKTGEVVGTAGFMSPEQLRGERGITPRSDLYCLGAILFELLEGRAPFLGDGALEISMAYLLQPIPRQTRPDTPPHIATLVQQLLAKLPEDRPATAELVLRRIDGRRSTLADVQRSPRYLVGGVVVLTTVVAVGLLAMLHDDGEETPQRRIPAAIRSPTHSTVVESPPEPEPERRGGCGHVVAPGPGTVERLVGLEHKALDHVYVPANYDPNVPHAALILFGGHHQLASQVMQELAMESLADEHGIVLLAVPDAERRDWKEMRMLSVLTEDIERQVRLLPELLCIDRSRMWGLSKNRGGYVAEMMACKGLITGIVASSYRRERLYPECEDASAAVPYLTLSPLRSIRDALEGDDEATSLEEHEQVLRARNRCSGERRRTAEQSAGGTCFTWDCDVPLISCHLDTGETYWPGYRVERGDKVFIKPPIDFDYHSKVWSFLSSLPETDPGQ